MKEVLLIAIGSAIVNNVVLSQFLGLCPFFGVSKKVNTAAGMGAAVIFVITIASFITSVLDKLILQQFDITYLRTIVFILVIAALVQFVEMFMKKSMPPLYNALGIFLPLITTNCAVLGVALNNVQYGYGIGYPDTFQGFRNRAGNSRSDVNCIYGIFRRHLGGYTDERFSNYYCRCCSRRYRYCHWYYPWDCR